ncbi:hypothetical protein [Aequorivita echinoideorum]|nr:hypothetical protein [Aequorivita echinoideorum]
MQPTSASAAIEIFEAAIMSVKKNEREKNPKKFTGAVFSFSVV